MKNNTAVDASNLCQSCGLCCNGALFSYAQIYSDEKERVNELNFKVYERKRNKLVFDFPCSYLENSKCTIYSQRPKKCIGYFCNLAKSVIKGSEDLQQAEKIVGLAKVDYLWLVDNAPTRSDQHNDGLNLRDYLEEFQFIVQKSIQEGYVLAEHVSYCTRAFEFLKLIDHNFRETSLLAKYATLMQTIHFNDGYEAK